MGQAVSVFAILASAVVVLGGLIAVIRAVFKLTSDVRDSKKAVEASTAATAALAGQMTNWKEEVEWRLRELERYRWRA